MILRRGANWRPFSFALILGILLLQGCHSIEQRTKKADDVAHSAHFQQVNYNTSSFTIYAQEKIENKTSSLAHIYIEGDGYAWARATKVSPDPTPRDPVGLKLASEDPHSAVIYLARPCQYTKNQDAHLCTPSIWTSHRASPQVIESMGEVLEQIKQRHGVSYFVLFGYSGGATIAALLAAKRKDIKKIVTIAGNLDIDAWTRYHDISPLTGSLNPVNFASELRHIPQVHFVGLKDDVVPLHLTKGYMDHLGSFPHHKLVPVEGQDHHEGWPFRWRNLLREIG